MTNIAIHIGFPKTGTTTQQMHLFGKHSQIDYLGKPYADDSLKREILRLVMEESTTYDSTALKEYLARQKEKGNHKEKRVTVLSDELLVSASKVRDKGGVAHRLKDIFPGAKILVTVRNQLSILKSAYINGGRLIKYLPQKIDGLAISMPEWLEISWETRDRNYIGNVRYIDTIDYYARLFGKENVLVLLFEDFIKDKETFAQQVSGFLNIDAAESLRHLGEKHENETLKRSQLELELFLTKLGIYGRRRFITGAIRRLHKLKYLFRKDGKARITIPPEWEKRLKDLYIEGNRKLVEHYQLPLEKYNYPL
jgi:hypothetical protein